MIFRFFTYIMRFASIMGLIFRTLSEKIRSQNLALPSATPLSATPQVGFWSRQSWSNKIAIMSLMTTAGLLVVLICLALSEASSAQSMTISLGGEKNGGTTARIVQMLALLTVLSIAPSLLVMVTAFTRIVIVLSFLRTAIGAQSAPPSSVLMSLALFLTFFVMAPTFEKSYNDGIRPMMDEEISTVEGFNRAVKPIHAFMMRHVREKDLTLFFTLSKTTPPAIAADTPLRILVPSFMISELRRAFEIGFLIFIPFLIIDMAVASVLLAMGMMFLPPSLVSMPFKLIFFVLVDGWYLVAGSLIKGFGEN